MDEVSVVNQDKQYTFRCVERGHYNRVYIIQIHGDDEEKARQLAEKPTAASSARSWEGTLSRFTPN
jgi:hypothetical protein